MDKWFTIWFEDKWSILNTMGKNLAADLAAGYSYFGMCAEKQRAAIEAYKLQFDSEMDYLATLDEKKAERWCKMDLIKRGAIEI